MEAIRATVRAAVPVRGIPKATQQRPGERLIEDDERRPGSWGPVFVFVTRSEEGERPVGRRRRRGHRASRSRCGWVRMKPSLEWCRFVISGSWGALPGRCTGRRRHRDHANEGKGCVLAIIHVLYVKLTTLKRRFAKIGMGRFSRVRRLD